MNDREREYVIKLEREMAELKQQRDELTGLLRESVATLRMWKDVAPAVSLCAAIDAAIAKVKP